MHHVARDDEFDIPPEDLIGPFNKKISTLRERELNNTLMKGSNQEKPDRSCHLLVREQVVVAALQKHSALSLSVSVSRTC